MIMLVDVWTRFLGFPQVAITKAYFIIFDNFTAIIRFQAMTDNTKRFADHVNDYIKYRPSYPQQMLKVLEQRISFNKGKIVADIGSGTGLSSIPFLENGNKVFAVEPNEEMRAAQERMLAQFNQFTSINGTAESTTLADHSVDIIFSGQAFHWFDKIASKEEFRRILKPNGTIVLVWNSRSTRSAFQVAYEKILYDTIEEYKTVNHRNVDEKIISDFFLPQEVESATIANSQVFDLDGLKGRLKSSSYCPKAGVALEELMSRIDGLFSKFEDGGKVQFVYDTIMFWSK